MHKQCSECRKSLDASHYYKHPSGADGLTSRCKSCLKAYRKNRRQKYHALSPELLGIKRECTKCHETKSLECFSFSASGKYCRASRCKSCVCRYVAEYRKLNIDRVRESDRSKTRSPKALRRRRLKNLVKEAARRTVRRALRNGDIVRGKCEVCGKQNAEAHHDDYGKPLEVRWLCRYHHLIHHGMHVPEKSM
jgi:hypothetical protein